MRIESKLPETAFTSNQPKLDGPVFKSEDIPTLRGKVFPILATGASFLVLAFTVSFLYDAFYDSACPLYSAMHLQPYYQRFGIVGFPV